MQNTAKFLHLNAKPDEYDQLYLFLFGFIGLNLLKEKAILTNQIATKRKHLASYRSPHKESALLKMIKPLEVEESILKLKISELDFKDAQESSVKELVKIQGEISDLTIVYSELEAKSAYLSKSIDKLRHGASNIDGKELRDIYAEAGVAISDKLKRTYEDLVVFHNKILSNKINLILNELGVTKTHSEEIRIKTNNLQAMESNVFRNIKEPDTLKSIGQMYN